MKDEGGEEGGGGLNPWLNEAGPVDIFQVREGERVVAKKIILP